MRATSLLGFTEAMTRTPRGHQRGGFGREDDVGYRTLLGNQADICSGQHLKELRARL